MTQHKVGTREEWQTARNELAKLEAEQAQRNEEKSSEIAGQHGSKWSLASPKSTRI